MRITLLLSLALLVLVTSTARANSKAEKLIEDGIALRLRGDHQEALAKFEEAHALAPSARTFAQMGLAEASLHRWADAELHIATALSSRDIPWIQNARNRDVLEKSLGVIRSHIGLVSVIGPSGTEVSVDGRPAGRLPLVAPLRIGEGTVRMEGKAEGRQSAATDVSVPGGGEVTLRLDLPPISLSSDVLASRPSSPLRPAPEVPATPPKEGSPTRSGTTMVGVGLLGLSVAGIALGVVWIAMDGHQQSCPPDGSPCRLYDTKPQGWIAAGIGAALGAAGGILVWQGQKAETKIGLGFGSITAIGTF